MALTANQEVDRLVDQELREYGLTASAHVYKGGFVGLAADGYARAFVAGDLFLGLAYEEGDNSSGADDDVKVRVSTQGDFELAIASLATTDIGASVYASDDATATLNPDNASYIGYVVDFVSTGVGIVRLQTGNLIRGQSYTAVGTVDCETGQTPSTVVLVPASLNSNGMVVRSAYAVVTEQFAGSTQDQGIVTLQDSDGSSINITFTAADAGEGFRSASRRHCRSISNTAHAACSRQAHSPLRNRTKSFPLGLRQYLSCNPL
jgi:hypothetical protein